MVYINELNDMKLYARTVLLPRGKKNKMLGGLALLLTPNPESTIKLINNNFISKKYYNSYYIEKDVSLYINSEMGNVLERHEIPKYIHEVNESNVVKEGFYKFLTPQIIYNGYENHVNYVKKYITTDSILDMNRDLKAPISFPISITVSNSPNRRDIVNSKSIYMKSYESFNSDHDYELYCREMVYELLLKTMNPNIKEPVCDSITMVLSGTFYEHQDFIKRNTRLYALCAKIDKMRQTPKGMDDLRRLITNDSSKPKVVKKLAKGGMKEVIKDDEDIQTLMRLLSEAELEPIKKLKRNIKFASNKGSVHITNKINRLAQAVADGENVKNSIIKGDEKDNPNLSEVEPPTVDSVKSKINQQTGIIPTNNIKDYSNGDKKEVKEESSLDDEYIWSEYIREDVVITEDYIKAGNGIHFFSETSSAYTDKLNKVLYKERLRNNKYVAPIYENIKKQCPDIKNTFFTLKVYKGKNLFVDLSYYNNVFFSNGLDTKGIKGYNLYLEFLTKLINNPNLEKAGYTEGKVLLIPVEDWDLDPTTKMWMYTKEINPISIIYNLMKTNYSKLKEIFGDMDILFMGSKGFFKANFTTMDERLVAKFLPLLQKLRDGGSVEDIDANVDSKAAIVNSIIDNIEDSKNITIHHLTGKEKSSDTKPKDDKKKKEISKKNIEDNTKKGSKKISDTKKEEDIEKIVDIIDKAADNHINADDAIEDLKNNKDFEEMIAALDQNNELYGANITDARQKRMDDLDKKILSKKVNGKTVKEILEEKSTYSTKPLEKVDIPIDSINEEWHSLTFPSLTHQYDPNTDIIAILYALKDKTYPVSIIDFNIEDTSTSEDFIYTYTVQMENHEGKRFSIKFDVPIIMNDQYLVLRGNKKVISTQSFLMPIIKTDVDTVQIVSNYNKIFIRRYNTAIGKSNKVCDRIIKTLKKESVAKEFKINWKACDSLLTGFDLPIDFIDIASVISSIETDKFYISFNVRDFINTYKNEIDLGKGIPYACTKNSSNKTFFYYEYNAGEPFSNTLYLLLAENATFSEEYSKTNPSTKYTYSRVSIMSSEIPLILILAYSEGLTRVLDKGNIEYNISEKKPSKNESLSWDFIKFSDGYLSFDGSYEASLLLNGLKECPTEMYSITEANSRTMYLEFLDNYGGRLKADGIDNFYDCMLDPITIEVLEHYKMPTNYVEVMLYANKLLYDTKYYDHGKQEPRRFRKNEIIAGYAYKAIAQAYGSYSTQIKHGRQATITMKKSAVIDAILLDPTCSDLSVINPLNEKEMYDAVTTKGLSGMNSDRSYSLDKRSYDDSMTNVLSMSTGFAATVGINRQATLNSAVETSRGYVQPTSVDGCNSINSLCMSEALTPFGTTRDDPFRSAMTFIQTTRHGMKIKCGDPLLVTNGADEALPYLISDTFAHKAKANGKVVELVPDDHMIIQYAEGSDVKSEYIDLSRGTEKNSSSGFYTDVTLSTDLKEGQNVKKGQIVAYDKQAFSTDVGFNDNIAYNIGALAKIAILDTDEGFEDSAIVSDDLAESMTSKIIKSKEVSLAKTANIYNIVDEGQELEEGDTLMIIQSAFDEDDANVLLKNLAGTEEEISDLGRIPIKSSVTGYVHRIEVYRTAELEELSPSLRKLCEKYESKITKKKKAAKSYGATKVEMEKIGANYKLESTGRLKDTPDGVKIVFYLAYIDRYSIGDKLVYWSANKGVCKDIFPKGKEPYSLDRPGEIIHCLPAIASINGRMVTSIQNIGVLNRILIEATRKVKDMLGIEWELNLLGGDDKMN